jgi:hypothetical protein
MSSSSGAGQTEARNDTASCLGNCIIFWPDALEQVARTTALDESLDVEMVVARAVAPKTGTILVVEQPSGQLRIHL